MGLFRKKATGDTTNTTPSRGGGGKLPKLVAALLMLTFLVSLGLCASVVDRLFDGAESVTNVLGAGVRRKQVAAVLEEPLFLSMLLLTLIASSVGFANMLMAFFGGRKHHDVGARGTTTGGVAPTTQTSGGFDKHAALSSALTTFGLLALAFGFSCKAINAGVPGGSQTSYGRQINAINAFNIINLALLLLYLAALGMTRSTHHHATATHSHPTVATHKHVDTPPTTHGDGAVGYGAGNTGTTGYVGGHAAPSTTVPHSHGTHTRGLEAA